MNWYYLGGALVAVWAAGVVWVLVQARRAQPLAQEVAGKATWYGESYRGARMANGEPFDPDALTAASRDFDLGTRVEVSYRTASGALRSVVVTITDRGPTAALRAKGRVIDLSSAAFQRLAPLGVGLIEVTVRPAGRAE